MGVEDRRFQKFLCVVHEVGVSPLDGREVQVCRLAVFLLQQQIYECFQQCVLPSRSRFDGIGKQVLFFTEFGDIRLHGGFPKIPCGLKCMSRLRNSTM